MSHELSRFSLNEALGRHYKWALGVILVSCVAAWVYASFLPSTWIATSRIEFAPGFGSAVRVLKDLAIAEWVEEAAVERVARAGGDAAAAKRRSRNRQVSARGQEVFIEISVFRDTQGAAVGVADAIAEELLSTAMVTLHRVKVHERSTQQGAGSTGAVPQEAIVGQVAELGRLGAEIEVLNQRIRLIDALYDRSKESTVIQLHLDMLVAIYFEKLRALHGGVRSGEAWVDLSEGQRRKVLALLTDERNHNIAKMIPAEDDVAIQIVREFVDAAVTKRHGADESVFHTGPNNVLVVLYSVVAVMLGVALVIVVFEQMYGMRRQRNARDSD